MYIRILIAIHFLAALLPVLQPAFQWQEKPDNALPPFPTDWEGVTLHPLPIDLSDTYLANYPGEAARFTDGEREFLFRWISRPSRPVHAPEVCFKAIGYTIDPLPSFLDDHGRTWASFRASQPSHTRTVYAVILDDEGNSFYDNSSWYWAASTGKSRGPWLAITLAE